MGGAACHRRYTEDMAVLEETVDAYRDAIQSVKDRFGVRVLIGFGDTWDGDPAVYFTVIFSDETAAQKNFGVNAAEVTNAISKAVFARDLPRFPYFEVHSRETYDKWGSNWPSVE